MITGVLIIPGIDAIAKWLSADISAGQITWARFVFQSFFLLPFALLFTSHWRRISIGWNALRGFLLALTTMVFVFAIKFLPIADAIAIFFVEPLILIFLSAIFLKESIGWRRIVAVIIGLLGALIVIRPSFATVGWVALLPLVAALSFSFYLLITRYVAQGEEPISMQFFAGVLGAIVMSIALAIGEWGDWEVLRVSWPGAIEWGLLVALGMIGTVGHLLIVYAFQRAPATVLAPFQYLEIIGATVLGFFIFGDFPDGLTWFGIGIIIGAGVYVFRREPIRHLIPAG